MALSEAITEHNYRAGLPAAPRPLLPDCSAELAMREWRWNPHGVQLCGLDVRETCRQLKLADHVDSVMNLGRSANPLAILAATETSYVSGRA